MTPKTLVSKRILAFLFINHPLFQKCNIHFPTFSCKVKITISNIYRIITVRSSYDKQIVSNLWILCKVGIKGLHFMNPESLSWSQKPKVCKTSIFHKWSFPKYDNFIIISADDIYLSIWMRLNSERKKTCRMFWLFLNYVTIYKLT